MSTEFIIMFGLMAAVIIILIVVLVRVSVISSAHKETDDDIEDLEKSIAELAQKLAVMSAAMSQDSPAKAKDEILSHLRTEMADTNRENLRTMTETLAKGQENVNTAQSERLRDMSEAIKAMNLHTNEQLGQMQQTTNEQLGRMQNSTVEQLNRIQGTLNEQLTGIRETTSHQMERMQQSNTEQLEKMRETVDEKLQTTLNDRITKSFELVNNRLNEVYQGLGEMKQLAGNVGDLKKVLTNVKARGTLGEYQLGAILEEILTPDQYIKNAQCRRNSQARVEYAIVLPGDDSNVLLPVDSKFPADTYTHLVDAYDSGDPEQIQAAQTQLKMMLRQEAKDIRDKYINPPMTTDFGIMFLPFEGLYSEAVRLGMIEELQSSCKVNISGPSTFAALLNSLRMGFKTLAIQKRSSEVWNILSAVKTEFENFEKCIESVQKRLQQAGTDLDNLVGVRTRKITSKLKNVGTLPADEAARMIDEGTEEIRPEIVNSIDEN